jgi:hypothetical protein
MPKQNGTVGLTPAGQLIDEYLSNHNPYYTHKLLRFIHTFTCRMKRIRALTENDSSELDYLLQLIKNDYIKKAKMSFRYLMNRYVYSLLINYIKTLTKKDFKPNTYTQIRKIVSNDQ